MDERERLRRASPGVVTAFLLAISISLTGCVATKWQVQSAPPSEVLQVTGAAQVRLVTMDDKEVLLRDPVVERDSISGTILQPIVGPPVPIERQVYALSDVKTLAIKQPDPAGIAVLSVLAGFGLLMLTLIAAFALGCGGDCME